MHKNNFDFLRLLFASLVVVHHCYPIAGISEQDPLYYYSNGALSLSYLGVRGFFIISGYLIFQSLIRSESITDYLVKRLLRIYPALFVVLCITLIAAAFVYNGSLLEYVRNKSVWTYIPINLSLLKLQHTISGVFENNPLKSAINGSLWTIGYEFSMYVFIIPLFYFKASKEKILFWIVFVIVFILFILRILLEDRSSYPHIGVLSLDTWIHFALLFMSGAFLSVIKIEKYKHKNLLLAICSLLFIVLLKWQYFEIIQYFIFPPIVIIIGMMAWNGFSSIGEKFGDVSYGTYIYGFPIQQLLLHYFKLDVIGLLLVSLPLTLLFGYLSWHLVEKHALAKKKSIYLQLKKHIPFLA